MEDEPFTKTEGYVFSSVSRDGSETRRPSCDPGKHGLDVQQPQQNPVVCHRLTFTILEWSAALRREGLHEGLEAFEVPRKTTPHKGSSETNPQASGFVHWEPGSTQR
jgi:hypothetical protein